MFYYYVVRLFPSYSVFQLQGVFLINKFFKNLQKVLLCMVCFCWQRCLVIACYVTRQAQAARQLYRMTKWTLLQAASQERGCVDFEHHQAGRRGGEKRDAIGTGHGQGHREPLAKLPSCSPLQHSPGGRKEQVQSDASGQSDLL